MASIFKQSFTSTSLFAWMIFVCLCLMGENAKSNKQIGWFWWMTLGNFINATPHAFLASLILQCLHCLRQSIISINDLFANIVIVRKPRNYVCLWGVTERHQWSITCSAIYYWTHPLIEAKNSIGVAGIRWIWKIFYNQIKIKIIGLAL